MPAPGGDFNAFASQLLDASNKVAISESRMELDSSADCCPLSIRNSVALARLTHGRNCPTSGQCSLLKTIYQEGPPKVRFGSLAAGHHPISRQAAFGGKAAVRSARIRILAATSFTKLPLFIDLDAYFGRRRRRRAAFSVEKNSEKNWGFFAVWIRTHYHPIPRSISRYTPGVGSINSRNELDNN